jgi:uncharacterized damage-inducible protein DinB
MTIIERFLSELAGTPQQSRRLPSRSRQGRFSRTRRDTLNRLAHHRGQMTVYLRLLGAKVGALYGRRRTISDSEI